MGFLFEGVGDYRLRPLMQIGHLWKTAFEWTLATSRKEEGVEAYKIDAARDADAFPEPEWPTQSLVDLIGKTFAGRMIDSEDHPGLLRLIGAKQHE